ncbi:hypothetical protein [Shimia ponticola]|uniref:hypothetical protein n=1 Tax=Shimia ponticola TaxID=2582893 RepID=UPI0011BF6632|nr:hypothetical protein [Shimia ponticola]
MNPDIVQQLHGQLGESGAQGVICRAMEEIANRLSLIERCYYQRDMEALWRASKGLIGIADQVGLETVARVAGDVAGSAKVGDDTALAATLARLIRLGDRSLTVVWDVPELSV